MSGFLRYHTNETPKQRNREFEQMIAFAVQMNAPQGRFHYFFAKNNRKKIELTGNAESIFMELSKILKDKYEIHSCYTCRYGNFCPIGDIDNEIFCVNDFEPKCKSDLYFVTEDSAERKKRSRTLFDLCEEFQPCSDDYYTYK